MNHPTVSVVVEKHFHLAGAMVDIHRARKNDYVSLVECFGYRLQSVVMRAFMFVTQNAGGAADAYVISPPVRSAIMCAR